MNVEIVDKGSVANERCFVSKGNVDICCYYGYSFIEVFSGDDVLTSNIEMIYNLRDCTNKVIAEYERLNKGE